MSRPVLLITPVLCALIAVGLLSGCGGGQPGADRPAVVPVKGLVLYDGKPVEGAMVVFQPEKHEHGAAGLTDANGAFRLRTFSPDAGAVPGEFKVSIRKTQTRASGGGAEADDAEHPEGQAVETWLLPKNYSNPATSGLTATVTEGGPNEFKFELSN